MNKNGGASKTRNIALSVTSNDLIFRSFLVTPNVADERPDIDNR